jgi:VWFA-related protein
MIRRRETRLVVIAGFLLCVLHGGGSIAQQDPPEVEAAEPYFESVSVEIANIDVWVTDKQGTPVDGLEKDDFVVFRDGKAIEIANFYAVSGGEHVEDRQDGEKPASDPDSEGSDARAAPVPLTSSPQLAPEHQLWLILYVDNYNIDPIERNRVLPDLYRFLGRFVEDGGRAMLVSYDRTLKVRQPFTDQLSLLVDALAEIKDDSGFGVVRRREQMETLSRIDQSGDSARALLYARSYAEEQMNGVGFTVDALERFVDTLAGLPGRKALVHVSSGVPMLAGEEMFHAVAEKFSASEAYGEIPRHDTTREFEKLGRIANAHRVAFHTVDAGGLRGIEFGAAEYGGFVNQRLRTTLDSVVPENLQSPLRLMAEQTGGRTILNRNEILPALEEARQDFESFYSLGIASADGESGRYHKIEVKLREPRRDLRLRHRAGYRSKSTETRMQETLRSALMYAHQANPLGVQVRWGSPRPHREGGGRYMLPIQIRVPLRDLVLLPTVAGKHEVRLRMFVGAVGKDGGISEIDVAPLGLRLDDEHVEAARKESLLHTHQLLLSRGRQKVGVAILDVFGGESSIVTGFVQAGSAEAEGPSGP